MHDVTFEGGGISVSVSGLRIKYSNVYLSASQKEKKPKKPKNPKKKDTEE